MENYSFPADLLQTFRVMSDSVKVALIYMPGVFVALIYMIHLHHLRRRRTPAAPPEPQAYTILPPQKTPSEKVAETMRTLDRYVEHVEGLSARKKP
ncbi:hypothetical protein [uncultured Agrobacterium sp.]|uniref:hypothetical protein n=1 Tax=uncultured Agrobacterium sp. TaxID=157277 RepID=UPI002585B33B|nr:hypothetical protein [uncultured Agrobacterium sp.]